MFNLLAKRLSSDLLICIGLILFCLSLRVGVVALRFQELNEDADSYIGIANNLAAGRGFSIPDSTKPTAFRPPLYPILIAPISSPDLAWARAVLNLLAAAGSMIFIWMAAENLGFSRIQKGLALLVYGCDPLLLRYSSLSMTETVCSMIAAALLWRLVRDHQQESWQSHLLTGIVFGFCVLTRPTFWAFGILYGGVTLLSWLYPRLRLAFPTPRQLIIVLGGTFLIAGPWFIRNFIEMKSPILMTTHGGYTILLGNNEAFYAEVVEQPFGTVWDGSKGPGQAVWANGINQQMDALGLTTEIERDRWQGDLAKQTIRENPVLFLKSCWLRFVRFWNIFPSGPAVQNVPATLYYLVGVWYSLLGVSFLVGLCRVCRVRCADRNWLNWSAQQTLLDWTPILLLILSFTLVHLVYWSNVRMRAPIVPAIALVVGAVFKGTRIEESVCVEKTKSLHTT
ncbi:glycosyltransferase family 39 protein [Planctomicrobium sp.]|jgi:hypothetical protein|nr:glycosyltransferase family 39 protein [Planctomicrobium sp.]MBT5020910.1 hypothetical protein [Planctomicrobium sp.]MDB4733232.1 glycosyltransferase family 39 protein [Planctomicrobium sp.]